MPGDALMKVTRNGVDRLANGALEARITGYSMGMTQLVLLSTVRLRNKACRNVDSICSLKFVHIY